MSLSLTTTPGGLKGRICWTTFSCRLGDNNAWLIRAHQTYSHHTHLPHTQTHHTLDALVCVHRPAR